MLSEADYGRRPSIPVSLLSLPKGGRLLSLYFSCTKAYDLLVARLQSEETVIISLSTATPCLILRSSALRPGPSEWFSQACVADSSSQMRQHAPQAVNGRGSVMPHGLRFCQNASSDTS